ncbi:MAG: hypothetical protein ACE5H1_01175 [Thermodesulfobacteriota bacterium]
MITLIQLETRLRDQFWNIPQLGVIDLWDIRAKEIMPKVKIRNLINAGIVEWAMENKAEKDVWDFVDANNNQGLTANQRQYAMPSDLFIAINARVAYDDSINFRGSEIVFVDEHFLVDESLTQRTLSVATQVGNFDEWSYEDFNIPSLNTNNEYDIVFSTLGADKYGNTPPATFSDTPFVLSFESKSNRRMYVKPASETVTQFTVVAAATGDEPPIKVNFTLRTGASSKTLDTKPDVGLPERIFIWGNQFELDPIPDSNYTFRFFGYRRPSSLSLDADALDTYEYAEESVYLKCRELVARELGDKTKLDKLNDYERVKRIMKKFDAERHDGIDIVNGGGDYWGNWF